MLPVLLALAAAMFALFACVAWRLARCPVFGTLLSGLDSWAVRCRLRRSATIVPFPTQPRRDPPIVDAARRVA